MNIKEIRLHNNYDFLRVFAALSITFTHSYNLIGKNNEEPLMQFTHGHFDFSFIGLSIFFTISGYLVTKSAATSVSFKNFVWKRFLRIQPVLILLCLLTVFLLGPFFTILQTESYFKNTNTWTYFRNILPVFGAQFFLPGVFSNHIDAGINGSLWTLVVEERLYCIIGFFLLIGFNRRNWFLTAVLFLNIFYAIHLIFISKNLIPYFNEYYLRYAFMFLNAGALFLVRINFQKYSKFFFAIGIILSFFILRFESLILLWTWVLPITIIGFAYLKTPLNKTGKLGDFTYGIYIFAFPVQQALISYLGITLSPLNLFGYTLLVTFPMAVASWHLLEKRCLSFKNAVV